MKRKRSVWYYAVLFVLLLWPASIFAQENNAPEFEPSGNVWGYVFGDLYYQAGGDDITGKYSGAEFGNAEKGDNAFTFRRIYLGYDHFITPNLTGKLLLESGEGVLAVDGKRTVYIKAANLEIKNVIPRSSIFIGQSSTPTWSLISEKVWGYRYVEKTIADFRKLGSSNDLGVRVSGRFNENGTLGYSLMVANGTAAKPENNSSKKIYASVDAQLLEKKLIVELYGDYQKKERFDDEYSDITLKGFLAYNHPQFTIGVEPVYQIQEKNKVRTISGTNTEVVDKTPFGMTIFAKGQLIEGKLNAFARYDSYNPDTDFKQNDDLANPYNENFVTAGIEFVLHKNFKVAPNIWVNTYDDKRNSSDTEYYDRKADIVPRITVFWGLR